MIVFVTEPIFENKNDKIYDFCSCQNCFPKQTSKANHKQWQSKIIKFIIFGFVTIVPRTKIINFIIFVPHKKHSKTMYWTYRVVKMQEYISILQKNISQTPQFYY